MSPVAEVALSFSRPLRGAVLASPEAPLPAMPEAAPAPPPPPPLVEVTPPPVLPAEPPVVPDPQEVLDQRAFDDALSGLRGAAGQLGPQYEAMIAEMRQAAVELAVAVAGRLLLDKAMAGELPLEALVHQVVDRLPVRRNVVVSLNPDDLTLLRQRLGERIVISDDSVPAGSLPEVQSAQALSHGGEALAFHADPTLQRGSCRADAAGVSVLADLQTQLAGLRQVLLESVTPCSS